jgi:polysaccharide export outer membrane protein
MPASPAPLVSGEEGEIIKVDIAGLKLGTRPEMNLRLEGGDVLFVPRRVSQNFYVIGDVSVPGAYDLPRDVELTAAQAIVYAGGTLPQAKTGKAFLMRYDAEGRREAIPVDFKAILAGKQQDIPVRKDDIIFVPNSAAKTVGVGLLDMLPTLLQQWLIF